MPLTAAEQTLANMGTVMGEEAGKCNAEIHCRIKPANPPGVAPAVRRPLFLRLGFRLPRLFPVYGVNTPYTNRARLGKKHAHNRFWLDGRRVTWPLQRAAFPKAALFVMVGEHPSCGGDVVRD